MELLDGIGKLSGIGPKRVALLSQLGIVTLFDLLMYFPRAYIDQMTVTPFSRLSAGMEATVSGVVASVRECRSGPGGRLAVLTAYLSDGTGYLAMTWFNQPFLKKKLDAGRRIFATGRVDYAYGGHGGLAMTQMSAFEILEDGEGTPRGGMLPVYATKANLNQNFFR
ncbi:MAG: DNA helicase RecG, partial [Schwartzia sp.]|nr:DNA helicase RecG [Schwartzia sp. (in: firmicutes)]